MSKILIPVIWILLSLTNISSAVIQPVLVRHPFNARRWYAYIPADNNGIYWTRLSLGVPYNNMAYGKNVVPNELFYGIIRSGRVISAFGGNHPYWKESGSWSNYEFGNGDIKLWKMRKTSAINSYADINIPANYNMISIILYTEAGTGKAQLQVRWDDGTDTGLNDNKDYDTGAHENAITEVIVAENAAPDGIKKLRINHAGPNGQILYVVGVRCWDTNAIGNPAATRITGYAEGHDLVTKYAPLDTGSLDEHQAVLGQSWKIAGGTYSGYSPMSFALRWAPAVIGYKYKWVGAPHFGKGNASYTYHFGEYANGPDIRVDGSKTHSIYDDENNPRNRLLTGNSIVIYSRGFSDYTEDGIEDANEAKLTWSYEFTKSGITEKVSLKWAGPSFVNELFAPMLNLFEAGVGKNDYLRVPPEQIKYPLNADSNESYGNQVCEVFGSSFPATIRLSNSGPTKSIFFINDLSKLYQQFSTTSFPRGTYPNENSDIWFFSYRYEIFQDQTYPNPQIYLPYDINQDKIIDFLDFEILASHWLEDYR